MKREGFGSYVQCVRYKGLQVALFRTGLVIVRKFNPSFQSDQGWTFMNDVMDVDVVSVFPE